MHITGWRITLEKRLSSLPGGVPGGPRLAQIVLGYFGGMVDVNWEPILR